MDRRGTVTTSGHDRENHRFAADKDGVHLSRSEYDAMGDVTFRGDANGNASVGVGPAQRIDSL